MSKVSILTAKRYAHLVVSVKLRDVIGEPSFVRLRTVSVRLPSVVMYTSCGFVRFPYGLCTS